MFWLMQEVLQISAIMLLRIVQSCHGLSELFKIQTMLSSFPSEFFSDKAQHPPGYNDV